MVERSFHGTESFQQFLPFGEETLFLFGGQVAGAPYGAAWPQRRRPGAGEMLAHSGGGGSPGWTRVFQGDLMGDP